MMYLRFFYQIRQSWGTISIRRAVRGIFSMPFKFLWGGLVLLQCIASAASASDIELATTFNNRANLYLIQLNPLAAKSDTARLDTAIAYYQKAVQLDPNDPGIKLNLGIAYLIKNDTTLADACFEQGLAQCDTSLERAFSLLGIEIETPKKEKASAANTSKEPIKYRLKKAQIKIKKPEPRGPSKPNVPKGPKSIDPQQAKVYLYQK